MASDSTPGVFFHKLSAGGQVGELIGKKDWAQTPLGPRASWPRSLNNHLSMIFELPSAAILFWGSRQIQLYNDGYSVIMGPRHPVHLGSTFRECWPEAYDGIYPWMQKVLTNGETVEVNRTLVPLTRFGFTDESYFTFSFSPLRDDDGRIAGVLQLVTEVTESVLGERRTIVLHELTNRAVHAKNLDEATALAARALGTNTADLPFSLIYAVETDRLILSKATGLAAGQKPFPEEMSLRSGTIPEIPELATVVRDRVSVSLENLALRFPDLKTGPWPESCTQARAFPIMVADQKVVGVLILGISPRLKFDKAYETFLQLISAQLGNLITSALSRDAELKRAETLAQIGRDLERSNKELEAFSYSVSHDLRAPLRAIDGFSRALLDDYADKLDDEGRRYLDRVRLGTQRMGRLIDDLLSLSKITRNSLSRESVDLPALARKIFSDLKITEPNRNVEIIIEDKLIADADPKLVIVLLENLLGNAWKFTSKRPVGKIEMGRTERVGQNVFFIRDNGAGFNMEHVEKLFSPFQRLHTQTEFEGTGIGLATVQRIVARHGGHIWAEGTPDKGATFFFNFEGKS